MENGHVKEMSSIKKGEWLCCRGGLFNGGGMVILQRWSFMEGEWPCYTGGQFNGGTKVVTKDACIMEGEWSS